MADPLSVAGLIVSVISVGIEVTGSLSNYLDAVKAREEELRSAKRQATDMAGLLSTIKDLIPQVESSSPASATTIGHHVKSCDTELRDLRALLSELLQPVPSGSGIRLKVAETKMKLTYPFNRSHVSRLEGRLSKVNSTLQTALGVVQLNFSVTTSNETRSTSNEIRGKVNEIHGKVNEIHGTSNEIRGSVIDMRSTSNETHGAVINIRNTSNEIHGKVNEIHGTVNEMRGSVIDMRSTSNEIHGTAIDMRNMSNEMHGAVNEMRGLHNELRDLVLSLPVLQRQSIEAGLPSSTTIATPRMIASDAIGAWFDVSDDMLEPLDRRLSHFCVLVNRNGSSASIQTEPSIDLDRNVREVQQLSIITS
ncbi:hypothetical protein F5B21DRAFT_497590 [Xylaria acuta]|nr:hypothetical protein F5B21DRAFT_497590 [Xylaria acuta]